jgi:hypothetical protein
VRPVTGLSLLIETSLGCLGLVDTAEPLDDEVESVEQGVASRDPNVGFTIKSGNLIKGSGSLPCASSAMVRLQRTWHGIWGQSCTWLR